MNGGITLDVVYKKWEEGKGLEDAQAEIYIGASGLRTLAWQIRERNIQRGPDSTRYALTKDGKPLAYVTSTVETSRPGRALIGYPWSLPDCPPEAKEKIFNEQLSYIESQEGVKELVTAVVIGSKVKDDQLDWFTNRGFVEEERIYRYVLDLDVGETTKKKVEGKASKLTSRVVTEDDIESLIELLKSDENQREAFSDDDGFLSYFKDRVFPVQSPIVLFDGDKMVAATAPLRMEANGVSVLGEGERIIMRFLVFRPGYEYAWDRLLVEFSKLCETIEWTDIQIQTGFGFTASGVVPSGVAKIRPELEEFEILLVKKLE